MTDLLKALAAHQFYHIIDLGNGLQTPGLASLAPVQAPVLDALRKSDLRGKRVLDIGCRDGLFSFEAERLGAKRVLGIDNDLSRGAVEVLIPHFRSKIETRQANLYDFTTEERFDVVIFAGVLYHLRFPAFGLKRIADCMANGGVLIIETGMLLSHTDHPFVYTPAPKDSPFDPSSVTFYNEAALVATLESLGFEAVECHSILSPDGNRYEGLAAFQASAEYQNANHAKPLVGRGTYTCRRANAHEGLDRYWYGTHSLHTCKEDADRFLADFKG
jgi:SAM-dependent methyltransferase